jgi:alpha-1,6-mannosyltransferase
MMSRQICTNTLTFLFWSLISVAVYFYFSYALERHEHLNLGASITLLFMGYYYILRTPIKHGFIVTLGIVFRLIFLFSIPNLSQDFYRFIWDGRLLLNGLNPYLFTPNELINTHHALFAQMQLLHDGMGALSAQHFSNYPPMHQLPFVIAALISKNSILGSVVVMRIIIILADIGILMYGRKLLGFLKIPKQHIFFYFLNPLVIIELSGNLHFEALMLFFLTIALFFLYKQKQIHSAIFLGFSILTKLLPVLVLPLLIPRLKFKKTTLYFTLVGLCMVVLSSPFFELQFLKNYSDTVGLWFTNFEFNSSFYSIGKPLMSMLFKIRLIEYMPFIVPIFVVFVVLYFMRRKTIDTKTIAQSFFWILTLYFLVSTTVHPWYLTTLVFLSCFTRYKFALVWSATVFLSYFGYQQNGVDDNTFWKLIEYFSVGMYLLFEGLKNQKTKASSSS